MKDKSEISIVQNSYHAQILGNTGEWKKQCTKEHIYLYIHTHTHTHIKCYLLGKKGKYIYIYIYISQTHDKIYKHMNKTNIKTNTITYQIIHYLYIIYYLIHNT